MRTSERITMAWSLARDGSIEGERLRRRVGALGALALLLCGFLATIGLAMVVLAFLGGVAISIAVAAAATVWPEARQRAARGLAHMRSLGRRGIDRLAPLWPRVSAGLQRLAGAWPRVSATWPRVSAAARPRVSVASQRLSAALPRASAAGEELAAAARRTALRFAPRPARAEPQREALRLNAAGTQDRRNGRYVEAVESHRQALEILRELGDRRAVALTQSNLALALSHTGDDEWAIGLFEEAAATLRDLGDEEHEAQIMANLGLAHRRHGRREEGDNVLELALTKLSPESTAYHQIEAELRRAS
jgi:tetratricopeptide (TPR) repeat protein